eukprot:TRINITY_DN28736_c0_g2_i1.p1 TRINITY_DN28736_c0_g2~~TRINITY_DN28736_c0_g2_i1.p1  ORF type:complete len:343 (+),score=66.72 TRINITY_DN28736_c0_g2_i1:58-1086(+)
MAASLAALLSGRTRRCLPNRHQPLTLLHARFLRTRRCLSQQGKAGLLAMKRTPRDKPESSQVQALITLSGHTRVSSDNEVWFGIAKVMSEVRANIEDAAIVSMDASTDEGSVLPAGRQQQNPRFMVSAFNTHISPFSLAPLQQREVRTSSDDEVAVAFVLKASVSEEAVLEMSNRFHTRFPGLVCTVTVGSFLDLGSPKPQREELIGMIRLFGTDQIGQLARIAEALHNCRVTILNLLSISGIIDRETNEFVEQVGGPFVENFITVAAIDRATFNEEVLREEISKSAREVGYDVASVILERDRLRAQKIAKYYLRRKEFISEISSAMEVSGHNQCDKAVWSV